MERNRESTPRSSSASTGVAEGQVRARRVYLVGSLATSTRAPCCCEATHASMNAIV